MRYLQHENPHNCGFESSEATKNIIMEINLGKFFFFIKKRPAKRPLDKPGQQLIKV